MELKRQLSVLDVFCLAAGAMISSGLFVLPAIAYQTAGNGILLAYALAGLLMVPAILSQLELVTALPRAGGTYFFIERILGTPAGIAAGLANWFSISLKSAFALMGIGAFATLLAPGLGLPAMKLIAAGACCVFTLLNLASVKSSGRAQVLLVFFLLLILSGFILIGYRAVDVAVLGRVFEGAWKDIFAAAGLVFISYGGITKIASVAEEVRDPKRTLVWGMLGAFICVQIVYLLTVFIVLGTTSPESLGRSLTPVSTAAARLAGTPGLVLTACAAMLAFITTANAGIMTASRSPLSMSRDGLLPPFFGRITARRRVPAPAVLMTGAFMILVIVFLDLEKLAKVASLFMILTYLMVNLAVIVVRSSRLVNYRPTFRAPLFPYLQIAGCALYVFLIVEMGTLMGLTALVFLLLSLIWYLLYARGRIRRKSAFIHLVSRLTSRELAGSDLENELLSILIERNEIVEDRFDALIRDALFVDMDGPATRAEVFTLLAERLAVKTGLDAALLRTKLESRERQASTIIFPGVAVPHAVPHIVVEGEQRFEMAVVRNRGGITWEPDQTIYTAFCLLGSRDERNFHLRALVAIAQIIQDFQFNDEWMKAESIQELRTLLLLAKRKRTF